MFLQHLKCSKWLNYLIQSTWVASLVVDSSFPIFFLVRFHFWNTTKKPQRFNSADEQQILQLMLQMIRLIYLNILPCSGPAGQTSDVLLRKSCVSERCPPSCPAVCWTCCWQASLCVLYDGWDCFEAISWIFSNKKTHHSSDILNLKNMSLLSLSGVWRSPSSGMMRLTCVSTELRCSSVVVLVNVRNRMWMKDVGLAWVHADST